MKIKLLLTGLITAAALNAVAQRDTIELMPHRQGIRAAEKKAPGVRAQKSTSLASRITGLTFTEYNGAYYEPIDSISFSYSKNNGGDLNSNGMNFDNASLWQYNPGTGTYTEFERATQTFDANNNVTTQSMELWDASGSAWVNMYRELYTYDSRNNMLTDIRQNWNTSSGKWENSYQYMYTYNNNNMQLTEVGQYWKQSASKWKNSYKYTNTFSGGNELLGQLYQVWIDSTNIWGNIDQRLYVYDQGTMLSYIQQYWNDSLYSWDNRVKYTYTYDGSGNETVALRQEWNENTSKWKNDLQDLYTYDGQKNLLNEVHQEWQSGAWQNAWQDMYTYNGTNDRVTELGQHWSNQQSDWKNDYFDTSAYDNRHNETWRLTQDWKNAEGAFVNDHQYDYTYNKYDQLTSQTSNTWNAGGFWQPTTSDFQDRFHYEEYGETGIAPVAAAGNTSIYPSPAQSVVNIDLQWNKDQSAVMSVFDPQGRLLNQWNVASTRGYHTTMPVASLPAGVYILKVKGEQDQAFKQFIVVH